MTPEEWLANFESTIADVKTKAATFQENLEKSGATESSSDGSIRVTVAPNGSLTDLQLADVALQRAGAGGGAGARLAAEIMKLARKAQRDAAVNVAEAFAPLGGDSEAMHMVTGYIPPEEPEEQPPVTQPGPGLLLNEEYDQDQPPPPARPSQQQPPSRPQRGRPRPPEEDDDFGDNSILRRD